MIHYEMMAKNDPEDRVAGFRAEYKKKLNKILRNKEALSVYKKPYNELTDAQKQPSKKRKILIVLKNPNREKLRKNIRKYIPII